MKIETKNKVYKGSFLAVLIVGVLLVGSKARAEGNFLESVAKYTGEKIASYLISAGLVNPGIEPKLGSAQTVPVSLTDPNTASAQDSLYVWGTGAGQGLEVAGTAYFDGAVNVTGTLALRAGATIGTTLSVTGAATFASDTRAASLVETGAVVTKTATSTLTAAETCNAGVVIGAAANGDAVPSLSVTLPSSSTLFSDCLTTDGDMLTLPFYNQSAITSTLLAVGTGGTASASSTLLVQKNNLVVITIVRTSTIGYMVEIR